MGELDNAARQRNDLRNIIIGPTAGCANRAHEIVAAIEVDLYARGWPHGATLGTLLELQRRFAVGRPVCLEAAAIMQTRRMIDIKRGPGGGIYVVHPDASGAARALLLSLTLRGVNGRSLNEMRGIALRLAVREALQAPGRPVRLDGDCFASSRAFRLAVAEGSSNPGVSFVTSMVEELYEATDRFGGIGWNDCTIGLARRLASAITRGDRETAELLQGRLSAMDSPTGDTDLIDPSMIGSVTSLNNQKYAGRVAGLLLREIAAQNEYPVKLGSERAIADRFGFDAHVVRQALRMLEDLDCVALRRGRAGGLVGFMPSYGAVIRRIATCMAQLELSFQQSITIAGALAAEAAQLAAERVRAGEIDPALLDQINGSLREAGAVTGISEYARVQDPLIDLAMNPILGTLLRAFALSSVCRNDHQYSMEFSAEQAAMIIDGNLSILAAIRAGDAGAAEQQAWEKHLLMRGH